MRMLTLGLLAAASIVGGCAGDDDGGRPAYASDWHHYRDYDYDRPDPRDNGYYADRYYRDDTRYHERRLSADDRIYRGRDGRYYCRRSDGTTGLIVGGVAGGVLGNVIAPGGSKTLGTLLGAAGGAAIGNAVDRDNVTCR